MFLLEKHYLCRRIGYFVYAYIYKLLTYTYNIKMRRIIVVFSLLLFAVQLTQAQVQVTGKIVDGNDKTPLIGVAVIAADSEKASLKECLKNSTCTDINGRFTIRVPDMDSEIKVSYIGYQEKTVRVSQDMTIELDWDKNLYPRKERREVTLSTADKQVIEHVGDLSLRLMRALPKRQSTVFSPLSLAWLLSLANDGAATRTQKELNQLLGATPKKTDSFYRKMTPYFTDSQMGSRFLMANALFVNNRFQLKQPFLQQVTDNYGALVRNIDLADPKAVQEVNDWCARQTDDMIRKMVDGAEDGALLYGLNAVFFNSKWKRPFHEDETKDETFTTEDGTCKTLPMMHREAIYSFAAQKGYTALLLPYIGEVRYDMTLLLPDKGQTTSDLLSTLSPHALQQLRQQFRDARVDVKIPRFETEADLNLNEQLCQLGIPTAFDKQNADFSRMADVSADEPDAHLCLSKVLQKAKIEVNEKGTHAAAVTYIEEVVVTAMGMPKEFDEFVFHADRPFLYLITEHTTGTVIFIGQYHGD